MELLVSPCRNFSREPLRLWRRRQFTLTRGVTLLNTTELRAHKGVQSLRHFFHIIISMTRLCFASNRSLKERYETLGEMWNLPIAVEGAFGTTLSDTSGVGES